MQSVPQVPLRVGPARRRQLVASAAGRRRSRSANTGGAGAVRRSRGQERPFDSDAWGARRPRDGHRFLRGRGRNAVADAPSAPAPELNDAGAGAAESYHYAIGDLSDSTATGRHAAAGGQVARTAARSPPRTVAPRSRSSADREPSRDSGPSRSTGRAPATEPESGSTPAPHRRRGARPGSPLVVDRQARPRLSASTFIDNVPPGND